MTYRMLQMLHLLQAFSGEKWKRAKKSEECAVGYRQVPYLPFGRWWATSFYQPTNITRHLQDTAFSDNIAEDEFVFRIKNGKAEAW